MKTAVKNTQVVRFTLINLTVMIHYQSNTGILKKIKKIIHGKVSATDMMHYSLPFGFKCFYLLIFFCILPGLHPICDHISNL